ncbi:MAG: polysaccharide pyruvyl transferase family protein [Nitrososphaerota archaeon]
MNVWLAFLNADLIIIGGGGIIEDATPSALIHYSLPVIIGNILGKKVTMFSIGIGPLTTFLGKEIARATLDLCDLIYVRDIRSYVLANQLSIKTGIRITIDPALAYVPSISVKHKNNRLPHIGIQRIGIALTVYPNARYLEDKAVNIICKLLYLLLHDEKGAIIIFFSGSEKNILYKLQRRLGNSKLRQVIYVNTRQYEVTSILEIVKQLTLMISMRLHFAIAAKTCGIPLILLSCLDKVRDFAQNNRIPFIDLDKATDKLEANRLLVRCFSDYSICSNKPLENQKILLDHLTDIITEEVPRKSKGRRLIQLICLSLLWMVYALLKILSSAR